MKRRRTADSGAYPHEGKTLPFKCGWCMDADHAHCRAEFTSALTRATYVCSCECRAQKKTRRKKGDPDEK